MSDSEDSTVTYTEISSPYEDLSDIGSPGAEGPIFQDPPSPDYVPGPEEPEQAPPSPIYVPFVPKPVYPEFLPEDDVLPAEEQPLPVAASPTTESPGYIPESDPEEDPEEDDEEDPEEDPADYPADRGDDRDDEEPSDDDDDDDDDAEEEEHLAPADPAAVAYSADQDPYLAYALRGCPYGTGAWQPFLSEEVAERLLALPTPPPLPHLSITHHHFLQITLSAITIPSQPPNSLHCYLLPLRKRHVVLLLSWIRGRGGVRQLVLLAGWTAQLKPTYRIDDLLDAAPGTPRLDDARYDRALPLETEVTVGTGIGHSLTALPFDGGRRTELSQAAEAPVDGCCASGMFCGAYHFGLRFMALESCGSDSGGPAMDPAEPEYQRRPQLKMAPRGRALEVKPRCNSNTSHRPTYYPSVHSAQLQAMIDGGSVTAVIGARARPKEWR
ncbi:hypothetical protein Tco_0990658 [Tanacetum coccineum]|uniref:Uncharacterized protein n=1 Tax=Tanacetum coccineum TaxID=301880 RepID=A0ABQ5EXH0_9ASTR